MNLYEKNRKCIEKNQPELYKKWTEYKRKPTFLKKIEKQQGKIEGEAVVVETEKGVYRLNSSYSPQEEAKRWCKQYDFQYGENIVFVFGMGNGCFVREIFKKLKEEDKIIIYEPSAEIFQFVLENFDITDIIENKQCLFTIEEVNEKILTYGMFVALDVMNLRKTFLCKHPQYERLFPELCVKFLKEIRSTVEQHVVNVNTEKYFLETNIENICSNLRYLKTTSTLRELAAVLPQNATAVLVAAGPSVGEQISTLKKVKGRTVIFAVDRILDYLLDNGVEPDFVLSVDAKKGIEYFTKRKEIEVPLIYLPITNIEVMEVQKGKKIICQGDFVRDIFEKLEKPLFEILLSPSVATLGFSVIAALGFKRVILVGQDLAFGKGGNTHAGGIIEEALERNPECMVEGLNGEKVRSRYDWESFIKWYDDFLYQMDDIEVLDVKLSGAKIPRTKNVSFEEALKQCKEKNIWSKEQEGKIEPVFSEEEWKRVLFLLEEKLGNLHQIRKKCKQGKEIAKRLVRYYEKNDVLTSEIQKQERQVNKIVKEIEEQPEKEILEPYIKAYAMEALWNIKYYSGDLQEDKIKTYEYAQSMLHAIGQGADFMEVHLKKTLDELKEAEKQ